MNLEGTDLVKLSKLISQQIDHITCVECCKHYIAPETATCGHTLCHNCWRGRKTCPVCGLSVERKQIRLNQPIQKLTERLQLLGETFEKLFKIKLVEFLQETDELESENDPTKNVKDWLASSQNQFSAPAQSSDPSSQELRQNSNLMEVSSSKIQVHTPTKKTISPEKVAHVSIPQDDWDKIEAMPATEVVTKNKENIIGPMDIEPFYFDDNEYTANNPRRSSRKRELKSNFNTNYNSSKEKENLKDLSDMDKKSGNTKQNWNNVKKMRKEFSKLNKINRNKLNVSIEMCKKTQSVTKPHVVLQNANTPQVYEIDDNTPKLTLNELPDIEMIKVVSSNHNDDDKTTTSKETAKDDIQNSKCNDNLPNQISRNMSQSLLDQTPLRSIHSDQVKETSLHAREPVHENQVRMPFYKKSALYSSDVPQQVHKEANPMKTINHNIESNTNSNEDIEITIKVGNTVTNIVIKKKNDVQLKVNTDREVQTSLCPQEDVPQKIETRNVSINIDSNNEVNIEHKKILQGNEKQVNEHTMANIKKQASSEKSASVKKNTASADTGTGQFEITESIEKELSNIMECAEIEDQHKAKSVTASEKVSQGGTSKPQSNPEITSQKKTSKPKTQPLKNIQINTPDQKDLSYLNDIDLFESDTVKENVQILKYTKNTTPSEILISTAHNRNKTQKLNEKRKADENEDLPASKKQKLNDTTNKTADLSELNKPNQPDSEPLNYDSIMGKVFANIDADMEEIKSQNIVSQMLVSNNHASVAKENTQKTAQNIPVGTQNHDAMSVIDCTLNTNDFNNPKDSENIFSVCVEKEDVVEASAPKIDKVPDEPQPNIDDYLTPIMSRNQEIPRSALVESQDIEIVNDDSESVVEDTPQKTASFGKMKQKSIGTNNATETKEPSGKSLESEKTKIVNLLETSERKSLNNVTVIGTRKITLETPLTINKFVNHIQHNSTPVARKSLNFESENIDDDPEQMLCPSVVAKTTQEKEFMRKAFEKTPTTQVVKPLSRNKGNKRLCIAGSCLSSAEIAKLKALCSMYKWSYVDKYTSDLTHLVVGVDEENKSQRSVKYMCALAASKWIVSNEWVDKCLETKNVVGEEKYEALDSTGEPGPRRSRVAHRKLFQGITFYCMEPFSVLSVDTLKEMLESSGGRVVSEVKGVRLTGNSAPAILLAEPENTQEDRFIYLAMELSIVPVNYEWVLNCLGCYTISSIQELLLCPSSLLPKDTAKWPQELMAREDD